jgi:hypothetical protein
VAAANKPPFVCQVCMKTFTQKGELFCDSSETNGGASAPALSSQLRAFAFVLLLSRRSAKSPAHPQQRAPVRV